MQSKQKMVAEIARIASNISSCRGGTEGDAVALVSASMLLLIQSGPKIVGEVVRIASDISSCRGGRRGTQLWHYWPLIHY